MRDIVATIQTDQFSLITHEPKGLLVIQGGPGTGKTAVGLHRASWLLYTYRRELERSGVLVVGPNPIFMDYISHVLPMLGEERVEQRAIDDLAGAVRARARPAEIARRKGDVAMAGCSRTRCEPFRRRRRDGRHPRRRRVPLPRAGRRRGADRRGAGVGGLARGGTRALPHARRAQAVRAVRAQARGPAFRSFDELEGAIRTFLGKLVDRAWPRVSRSSSCAACSRPRGSADAAGATPTCRCSTRRARSSRARRSQHGHVIVDEAQDLTPMQLRMLARRTTGAMTILGDIAQAAGPIRYHRWEELLPHLADGRGGSVAELRLAYRVPRQVMELALPLLR